MITVAEHVHKFDWVGKASVVHPRCTQPKLIRCRWCPETIVVRCGSSNRTRCEPCSRNYAGLVRRKFVSGWVDNDGGARIWMVTVTAPGEREHRRRDGSRCPCTPAGGVLLPLWNFHAGTYWNRFVTSVRRLVDVEVEYCKSAECQDRGAIHFHALFRCLVDLEARRDAIRDLAVAAGFGCQIQVERARGQAGAAYASKYVSKSVLDRPRCPVLDPMTGELSGAMRVRLHTSSRNWGDTMKTLRARQRAWAQAQPAQPAEPAALFNNNTESYADLDGVGVVVVVVKESDQLS